MGYMYVCMYVSTYTGYMYVYMYTYINTHTHEIPRNLIALDPVPDGERVFWVRTHLQGNKLANVLVYCVIVNKCTSVLCHSQ